MNYTQKLQQRIEQIESRMARDWRRFAQYDLHLVALKARLQSRLALAAAQARQTVQRAAKALERATHRRLWRDTVRFYAKHKPAFYGWAIPATDYAVIEE